MMSHHATVTLLFCYSSHPYFLERHCLDIVNAKLQNLDLTGLGTMRFHIKNRSMSLFLSYFPRIRVHVTLISLIHLCAVAFLIWVPVRRKPCPSTIKVLPRPDFDGSVCSEKVITFNLIVCFPDIRRGLDFSDRGGVVAYLLAHEDAAQTGGPLMSGQCKVEFRGHCGLDALDTKGRRRCCSAPTRQKHGKGHEGWNLQIDRVQVVSVHPCLSKGH